MNAIHLIRLHVDKVNPDFNPNKVICVKRAIRCYRLQYRENVTDSPSLALSLSLSLSLSLIPPFLSLSPSLPPSLSLLPIECLNQQSSQFLLGVLWIKNDCRLLCIYLHLLRGWSFRERGRSFSVSGDGDGEI